MLWIDEELMLVKRTLVPGDLRAGVDDPYVRIRGTQEDLFASVLGRNRVAVSGK